MFWVYVLQNPAGKFYVGQTDNVPARLANHNRTNNLSGKYTRKNGPWTLVWSELHPSRTSAMAREREIKRWKSAKTIRLQLLGLPQQLSGRVPARRD